MLSARYAFYGVQKGFQWGFLAFFRILSGLVFRVFTVSNSKGFLFALGVSMLGLLDWLTPRIQATIGASISSINTSFSDPSAIPYTSIRQKSIHIHLDMHIRGLQ